MTIKEQEGTVINARGQRLHTYSFVPRKPRCVIFFHHGFGEYSGRDGLPQVFRRWAANGFAVHTYDCHGHGHSEPREEWDRFLIWDFNDLVDDFALFTKQIRTEYESTMPMFLGGHSMGSLTCIHLALRDQAAWDGLILGTATVDVEWNWVLKLQASVGSILAMLIPRAEIVPSPAAEVTADAKLEHEIATDPLLAKNNVRARTANEMLRAFAHVREFGHLLWLPIYCHHGTSDKLASIRAVRQLLERVASADITMHEVQGGAHELFVGLEREQVTEYILQWVDAQLSPDTLSEPSDHRMVKSCSLISVTGNPFEWRPHGMSPASSIYGDSPRGGSPAESPRFADKVYKGPFTDDVKSLWQHTQA